jgi:uncharacterized protein YjiS (DUF1127 family)
VGVEKRRVQNKADRRRATDTMEVSMLYIGETRKTAFASFGAAASATLLAVALRVLRFGKALARRRVIADLAEFDDRMLRDIGLNRSDLRDAASTPMWEDPTSVLVVRAVEKRAARRLAHRPSARPASAQHTSDLIGCR